MNENLSPRQFALQADAFHRWAKSEIDRHYEENEFRPGHARFDAETGTRVDRLRRARAWLTDTASDGVHSGYNALAAPLHELLPHHTDLVDEWQKSRDAR